EARPFCTHLRAALVGAQPGAMCLHRAARPARLVRVGLGGKRPFTLDFFGERLVAESESQDRVDELLAQRADLFEIEVGARALDSRARRGERACDLGECVAEIGGDWMTVVLDPNGDAMVGDALVSRRWQLEPPRRRVP